MNDSIKMGKKRLSVLKECPHHIFKRPRPLLSLISWPQHRVRFHGFGATRSRLSVRLPLAREDGKTGNTSWPSPTVFSTKWWRIRKLIQLVTWEFPSVCVLRSDTGGKPTKTGPLASVLHGAPTLSPKFRSRLVWSAATSGESPSSLQNTQTISA